MCSENGIAVAWIWVELVFLSFSAHGKKEPFGALFAFTENDKGNILTVDLQFCGARLQENFIRGGM